MRFWKEHTSLRVMLIAVSFLARLGLMIGSWRMTGSIVGLGIMLIGLVLLLSALMIYNKAFQDEKIRENPKK